MPGGSGGRRRESEAIFFFYSRCVDWCGCNTNSCLASQNKKKKTIEREGPCLRILEKRADVFSFVELSRQTRKPNGKQWTDKARTSFFFFYDHHVSAFSVWMCVCANCSFFFFYTVHHLLVLLLFGSLQLSFSLLTVVCNIRKYQKGREEKKKSKAFQRTVYISLVPFSSFSPLLKAPLFSCSFFALACVLAIFLWAFSSCAHCTQFLFSDQYVFSIHICGPS